MEGFKPFGIPMRELEPVVLLFEEYEAIRLADYENLTQEEAAKKMDISRPTFTRVYDKARKNIAKAFIEGKAIIIQGGTYITDDFWYRCYNCHETMITMKPEASPSAHLLFLKFCQCVFVLSLWISTHRKGLSG